MVVVVGARHVSQWLMFGLDSSVPWLRSKTPVRSDFRPSSLGGGRVVQWTAAVGDHLASSCCDAGRACVSCEVFVDGQYVWCMARGAVWCAEADAGARFSATYGE